MICVAISVAAFEAIARTLPFGSVGYEAEANERGERYVWLAADWSIGWLDARAGRELQRCDPADRDDGAPLMSSAPKGKFAPRSPRPPSAFTEAERHAFAFAEEVRGLAVGIVDAAIAEVVFEGGRDPKVYGLALLCRSISNFQGALTMARLDQAVECRTLVRSCFENLFLVDQLRKHGVGFVKAMRSDDAANQDFAWRVWLKHPGVAESPLGKTVRGRIKRERGGVSEAGEAPP